MLTIFKQTPIIFALLLCSCTLGPDYQRPELELPSAWRVSLNEAKDLAGQTWWENFEDPALNKLVDLSLKQNQDLLAATARVEEFYSLLGKTRSEYFPQVGLNADYSRTHPSQNSTTLAGAGVFNTYDGGLGLNWELDVWGRIRRANQAARADILSQESARKAVILSLVSAVTGAYIELRDLDKRLEITRDTLTSRRESLRLATERFNTGVSSELDLRQAESELYSVESSLRSFELQVSQKENQLSVLTARAPNGIERGKTIDELLTRLNIPTVLPAQVIEQRPDILQAEQTLVAANARIGQAKAEYLPKFSLTGIFGFASIELSDWLKSPSRQWNINPGLDLPVFTAGRISSLVRVSEAQAAQAHWRYKRTIQVALQEVEDSLVGFQKSEQQLSAQDKQVQALQRYLKLSEQRYTEGQSSYLEVLDAQRSLLNAQLSLAVTQGFKLAQFISIYKAIGGGWVETAEKRTLAAENTEPRFFP